MRDPAANPQSGRRFSMSLPKRVLLILINRRRRCPARQAQFAEGARLLREALQEAPGNEVMLLNLYGLLLAQMRAEGGGDALQGETLGLLQRVHEINPDSAKCSVYMNHECAQGRSRVMGRPRPSLWPFSPRRLAPVNDRVKSAGSAYL